VGFYSGFSRSITDKLPLVFLEYLFYNKNMLTTQIFTCSLPKDTAHALNRESGRIYTATLVEHYRVYRHTGNWLSPKADEKLCDFITGATILHAHSRDAAQQGFVKACKTACSCKKIGLNSHYPHRIKHWRTTIWKSTGIRKREGMLLLALARGQEPVQVRLPEKLEGLAPSAFLEMRQVWDQAGRHYQWHAVIEDGTIPSQAPGTHTAGVDLGEVHPAAASDGIESIVFSARHLRSLSQYSNKRLAKLQQKQAGKVKGSKRWKRILRRKSRFLAQQKRRKRDIEHKVSRAVVGWALEHMVGKLAVGDVRDIADRVDLGKQTNQKISNWTHGKVRSYIEYKAAAKGIVVEFVNKAYTSQTCPNCGERHKPKGRVYRCPACGFQSHRDAVGAANIRSVCLYGKPGQSLPGEIKYRHPFKKVGMRSRPDTAHVARPTNREAAGL
jgi:putative transposase